MSSWAKEVLGRLFSSKDSSRAASDTNSSKTRAKPSVNSDAQQSRRHGSLVSAASFLKAGSRSRTKASTFNTDATNAHRRGQSQPLNSPPKIARLCHTRSHTQSNPTSRLPEYVIPIPLPVDDDDSNDGSPAVTAHELQQATQDALQQTNKAQLPDAIMAPGQSNGGNRDSNAPRLATPLSLHEATIEWEPPTWDDLWRDQARSIRTYSNSRLSTFMRTPKKVGDQNEIHTKSGKREHSISRKSSSEDLRSSMQPKRTGAGSEKASNLPKPEAARRMSVKQFNLQKKLPSLPGQPRPIDVSSLPASYLRENAARNARILKDLQDDGVLDLNNSEDTHTAVIWSPAVTHEKRIVQPIEVVQRAVSRDVHNHHIIHRVLPIVDCRVLPARHFVPNGKGGYVEISEDQIPGGKPDSLDQLIAEAVTKSSHEGSMSPQKFTSQEREDKGRRKERVSQEGKLETEQWWMHSTNVMPPGSENNEDREKQKPVQAVEPHPQKPVGYVAPRAQALQELNVSKQGTSSRKAIAQRAPSVVQRTNLDHEAEVAKERTRHQSFKYRTPDGLPSWTAITSEPQNQSRPAAHTHSAARPPEKSQRRPQPIHTILPVHVAYGAEVHNEYERYT